MLSVQAQLSCQIAALERKLEIVEGENQVGESSPLLGSGDSWMTALWWGMGQVMKREKDSEMQALQSRIEDLQAQRQVCVLDLLMAGGLMRSAEYLTWSGFSAGPVRLGGAFGSRLQGQHHTIAAVARYSQGQFSRQYLLQAIPAWY